MAKKLSKAEQKRLANAILSKAKKLWLGDYRPTAGSPFSSQHLSTKDFMAIEAIVKRTLKRIG